jgi:hypothetical protein
MTTSLLSLVATRLKKAAANDGFDVRLGPEGDRPVVTPRWAIAYRDLRHCATVRGAYGALLAELGFFGVRPVGRGRRTARQVGLPCILALALPRRDGRSQRVGDDGLSEGDGLDAGCIAPRRRGPPEQSMEEKPCAAAKAAVWPLRFQSATR